MTVDQAEFFQFDEVLSDELRTLDSLRTKPFVGAADPDEKDKALQRENAYSLAHTANLTGLAFSGGGIRSATFNLGVLQALAKVREQDKDHKKGLLSRFDYLSTVSGGGYIGSWFSAWLHRLYGQGEVNEDAVNSVQHLMSTRPCGFGPDKDSDDCKEASGFRHSPTTSGFPPLEHAAIRHLRRYSNYLTPRLGLSGDTLALVSLFLRNFVLIQFALVTLLAVVFFLPHFLAGASKSIIGSTTTVLGLPIAEAILGAGLIAFLVVLLGSSRNLRHVGTGKIDQRTKQNIALVNAIWVAVLTIAAWMIVVSAIAIDGVAPWYNYLGIGGIAYASTWWIGQVVTSRGKPEEADPAKEPPKEKLRGVLVPVFAGLIFGLLGWSCGKLLDHPWIIDPDNLLAVLTLGPPAILLVVSLIVTVHIGTARDLFSEMHREWWARLGGFVLLAGGAWAFLFATAFYAPPIIKWLGNGGLVILAAWAGTSGAGALIANRAVPQEDTDKPSKIQPLLMKLAPWLFVTGLAFLVAAAVYTVMVRLAGTPATWPDELTIKTAVSLTTVEILSLPWLKTLIGLVVTAILFFAITWGLDINIFSAHTMYKNRLVRAYLGASIVDRAKTADPFTAFNENDDLWLANLDKQRPIHIVNATLNMTGGDDLAWQTRRAASFAFTPRFVGYEAKSSSGVNLGDYRRTYEFAAGRAASTEGKNSGLKLGTVMAISGAAASPNMGYHTSAGISALLTAFNMRLGYWAGNPAHTPPGRSTKSWNAWRKKGPAISASPILKELTGSAKGESDWVNITDGGHFENLALYELVRRRCRFIVATDAGCDPKHRFQDLANAVRKCWTDLGVHIYLPNLKEIALKKETSRYSQKHGCIGLIEYPDRKREDPERYGILLYLKCSLTKDEIGNFVDIRQYATEHKSYPHQTTGDQFFDENQFEAYRHLGYCVVDHFRSTIDALFVNESSEVNTKEFEKITDELLKQQQRYESLVESSG